MSGPNDNYRMIERATLNSESVLLDAKASAADHMGHIVTVNGTAARVNGYNAIFVQGLTK